MTRKDALLLRGLKILRAIYETTDKEMSEDKIFQKIREYDIRDVNKMIEELEG